MARDVRFELGVTGRWSARSRARRAAQLYGDGSQTRAFCFVDDLVDGLIRLMDTSDDITGPINLGNPDEFTIRELAHRVVEVAAVAPARDVASSRA